MWRFVLAMLVGLATAGCVVDESLGCGARCADGGTDGAESGTTESGAKDAGEAGGYPTCWQQGNPDLCKQCCDMQIPTGLTATSNIISACMCSSAACDNECGTSLFCSMQPYDTTCRQCLVKEYRATGGCSSEYASCEANTTCKAYMLCVLGC